MRNVKGDSIFFRNIRNQNVYEFYNNIMHHARVICIPTSGIITNKSAGMKIDKLQHSCMHMTPDVVIK
jgi:hypothetical protein